METPFTWDIDLRVEKQRLQGVYRASRSHQTPTWENHFLSTFLLPPPPTLAVARSRAQPTGNKAKNTCVFFSICRIGVLSGALRYLVDVQGNLGHCVISRRNPLDMTWSGSVDVDMRSLFGRLFWWDEGGLCAVGPAVVVGHSRFFQCSFLFVICCYFLCSLFFFFFLLLCFLFCSCVFLLFVLCVSTFCFFFMFRLVFFFCFLFCLFFLFLLFFVQRRRG